VDDLLGSGDIQGAIHSMQDALEVVNLYRARVLHAEGREILKQAKKLQAPNAATPKSATKEMDAVLSQAYQKVQEARKLDHQEARYRDTLLEIEQLQKTRRVEELYERALDAQKKNRLQDARLLFKEILDLDPQHAYIKPQYKKLLLIDLEKKNTELQQKLKRKKNVKFDLLSIREILIKLRDIDALDPELTTFLNQIEEMLKH
jgi:tetratricopeptide (TPR) repeat protein